jgi:hypothetical protein
VPGSRPKAAGAGQLRGGYAHGSSEDGSEEDGGRGQAQGGSPYGTYTCAAGCPLQGTYKSAVVQTAELSFRAVQKAGPCRPQIASDPSVSLTRLLRSGSGRGGGGPKRASLPGSAGPKPLKKRLKKVRPPFLIPSSPLLSGLCPTAGRCMHAC